MTMKSEHAKYEFKKEFKKDFQSGQLFKNWANIYGGDGFWSVWAKHRMEKVLQFIDYFSLARKGIALEIGIGSGILLYELERRGCKVFGADFSLEMIKKNFENPKKFEGKFKGNLMVADLEEIPFKNGEVDLVTCIGVMEYLATNRNALSEIFRVLKPGGHVVLGVASYHRIGNLFNIFKRKILKIAPKNTNSSSNNGSLEDQIKMVNPLNFKQDVTNAGFHVKKFVCFGGKLMGKYIPLRFFIPGWIYIGDHCLMVLRKPVKSNG